MLQDDLVFSHQGTSPQTWEERWLALQTLFWLSIIDWTVRHFGFRRTVLALARASRKADESTQAPPLAQVWRWASVMIFANRRVTLHPAACLTESMTLWFLLRRRGSPVRLQVGVRTLTQFESHAWITYQGVILNDFEDAVKVFTPLDLAFLWSERETA